MNWEKWQPKYDRIVKRLDLKPEADWCAAKTLGDLITETNLSELEELINKNECIVFGAGPSLEEDLERMSQEKWLDKVLISADGATSALMRYKNPDVIVTDLDGKIEDQIEAWRDGAWMVVHAHGDNIEKIKRIVPYLNERVLGTVQVKELTHLHNFGGFTDGDRAAFMAHELGALRIYLAGMDLGEEIGEYSGNPKKDEKVIKLYICKNLLSWLVEDFGANITNLTSRGENIPHIPRGEIS